MMKVASATVAASAAADRPALVEKANPFQVYPVRSLSEVKDIVSLTVPTPEIQQVHTAVKAYADSFGADQTPPAKLLLAAKGDFGTGKTHLMLYAQSALAERIAERRDKEGVQDVQEPVAVLAVASEAPIEEWFATEVGPLLMERINLRERIRELLTRIAVSQAAADPDPEVQKLAEIFRHSRRTLYEHFREPGEFDVSRVEEKFRQTIDTLCPRTSRSFRRAIEALRWTETAEFAEEWLSGNGLEPADLARIGVKLDVDRANRAAQTICAAAAICLDLGRPFVFCIDEFEHLTRYDRRNRSKRNITWTKRLVEALAQRGAMVFISGHWEAWRQQGDFLDRFVGARPIQLLRLSQHDVLDIITARAGKNAWPGFDEEAARSVVEQTSGNIRRVITVLYDLWSDPAAPNAKVIDKQVRAAAHRRLQPGSEAGVVPEIETAVRAAGGTLQRKLALDDEPPFDFAAFLGDELRLVVTVAHARDELALFATGQRFAERVKALRAQHGMMRGLAVLFGAVLEHQVSTLDAALAETDLISGEDPEKIRNIGRIVGAALAPTPRPDRAPTADAVAALDLERLEAVERAETQERRLDQLSASSERGEAVRSNISANPTDYRSERALARDRAAEAVTRDLEGSVTGEFMAEILRRPGALVQLLGAAIFVVLILGARNALVDVMKAGTLPDSRMFYATIIFSPSIWIVPAIAAISGILSASRCWADLRELRKYRLQQLEAMVMIGVSARTILDEYRRVGDLLSLQGPRRTRVSLIEEARQALSQPAMNPSPGPSP